MDVNRASETSIRARIHSRDPRSRSQVGSVTFDALVISDDKVLPPYNIPYLLVVVKTISTCYTAST